MWNSLILLLNFTSIVGTDVSVRSSFRAITHRPCRDIAISLGQFTSTPIRTHRRFSALQAEVSAPDLDPEERQKRLHRLMLHLSFDSRNYEAWTRWFEYEFGSSWENILKMSQTPGADYRLLKMMEQYQRFIDHSKEIFAKERREHPFAFEIFEATPRSWSEWWQYFRYLDAHERARPFTSTELPSEVAVDITFDSNLIWDRESRKSRVPEIMNGLRARSNGEDPYRTIMLPETIAEAGENIDRQWQNLSRPEMNGFKPRDFLNYLSIVTRMQKHRLAYELSSRYKSHKPVVQGMSGDDRYLSQVALRGIKIFFTQDARMVDGLLFGSGQGIAAKESRFNLNGKNYRSAEISFSEKGRDFSFTVVDTRDWAADQPLNLGPK